MRFLEQLVSFLNLNVQMAELWIELKRQGIEKQQRPTKNQMHQPGCLLQANMVELASLATTTNVNFQSGARLLIAKPELGREADPLNFEHRTTLVWYKYTIQYCPFQSWKE